MMHLLTEGECVGDSVGVHVPGDKDQNQVYKEDTQQALQCMALLGCEVQPPPKVGQGGKDCVCEEAAAQQ